MERSEFPHKSRFASPLVANDTIPTVYGHRRCSFTQVGIWKPEFQRNPLCHVLGKTHGRQEMREARAKSSPPWFDRGIHPGPEDWEAQFGDRGEKGGHRSANVSRGSFPITPRMKETE